ncbi:pre-peptidase C-terminal domain-containing protein [Anaerovorax odorimutans]|uniref:Pre-peptidase C-terminal domain-containing protein n=1 Tax=Anaerovorax odorimutans TaxID=109327 RepID=A0ABT1RKG1_9FIRM|nr:pre-peptidase C-terminal domain-containing protein [Anaerovorax odorimutans]MCQ4635677.1 pre-peptidase C-terminal domain-containing protein [Anaerovorax odorimutans]
MKKGMSKLLSALLIATLVFTSAGVAFADTGDSGAKDEVKASQNKQEMKSLKKGFDLEKKINVQTNSVKAQSKLAKTKASGRISVATLVTGNENAPVTAVAYGEGDSLGNGKYGFSQAVYLPSKGTLILAAYNYPESSKSVRFGLFKESSMANQIASGNYYGTINQGGSAGIVFKVPAAGTYYIGAYSTDFATSPQPFVVGVNMSAGFISGVDRTITSGSTIAVGQKDAQTNYFKFKATQTGYLSVDCSESYNKITLCNSKKKALSNATNAGWTPTYGVKKGTTYYVKVAAGSNYYGGYQFYVTNKKITEKSGKKKSKAVTIKKKKTKKGTIIAGSSQADWYKFKLSGKKKFTLTMKGATNNTLKVAIYKKNGKKVGKASKFPYNGKKLTITPYGKLAKGTYYIKVYRGTKTSSGWYSLSWK